MATIKLPEDLLESLSRHAEVIQEGEHSEEELRRILPEVEALLCLRIAPERLGLMKNLRVIQCFTAGVDHLPWSSIRRETIVCSNAGSNAEAVAEFAVSLLLTAAKGVSRYDAAIKSGAYSHRLEPRLLYGRSIAVLGLGEIGRRVAMMARGMGMRTIGFTRSGEARGEVDEVYRYGELDKALSGRDYAVIALPLTKLTRGLINYEALRLMNRRSILVNIARAQIVVKEDLRRYLLENEDFIYASDVWWNPSDMEKDRDVLSLPNVVATPWVAGAFGSREVYERMLRIAVENLVRYLRGETPRNIVRHEDYA